MTTTPTEATTSSVGAFRDAQWRTRWLAIGLSVLLIWRSVSFVDREWLSQFSPWLLFFITGLAPQVFLLSFPILTRNPHGRATVGFPGVRRCLVEFGIAVPVVIGTIMALAMVNYLVSRFSPGSSLTPESITNLARSPNVLFVYIVLLFSFTVAPIAEEVFFRGFLYNAFRARMPLLIAGLGQSLVFGLSHFGSVAYIGYAFVLGLLVTAIYQWRKTLISPILVHVGINIISALGTVLMMVAHANSPVLGVVGDPNDTECVIRQIAPNSAAEEAGLQVGDIITSFNTEIIRDFPHFHQVVALYRPGDAVPVTINRSGSVFEVTVVLRRRGDG